eukprot:TRINITY_DN3183_c0_g1_i1.p1 TRINITY_DN3183_c0_g1~~TRINITY_DN3183_c0_g1_i1.p1  ORF type:complete len:170 (-),score=37.38 TRINITY_DN3183_c0_g1_i1:148-657(-)
MGERKVRINFGGEDDSDIGATTTTTNMADALPPIPTPSLHAKEAAKDLRWILLALLVLNAIFYVLGSFAGRGDSFIGDILLLLLAYFGQDLYRESALRLYFLLNIVSIPTDLFIIAGQYLIASMRANVPMWWLVIAALLFVGKMILKILSALRTKALLAQLSALPGQSI